MSGGVLGFPDRSQRFLTPMKVEWMVTRKCNMRCEYCIVPNTEVDELSFEKKIAVLDLLHGYNVGIVVLYGGEITLLGDELINMLKHANELGLFCAVITNGLRFSKDIRYFKEFCEISRNITVSVDWLPESSRNSSNDKTKVGWDVILHPMTRMIPDRVINVTMFRQNALEMPALIKRATDEGIWSILSLVNVGKKGFRYSGPCEDIKFTEYDRILLNDVCDELIEMKHSGKYMMHDEDRVYYSWKQWGIQQNWHCSRFTKFTIDADGTVLCCVDWQGNNPRTIFDVVKDEGGFSKWFNKNIWDCPGCCWSPLLLLESYQSIDEGNDKLSHGLGGKNGRVQR